MKQRRSKNRLFSIACTFRHLEALLTCRIPPDSFTIALHRGSTGYLAYSAVSEIFRLEWPQSNRINRPKPAHLRQWLDRMAHVTGYACADRSSARTRLSLFTIAIVLRHLFAAVIKYILRTTPCRMVGRSTSLLSGRVESAGDCNWGLHGLHRRPQWRRQQFLRSKAKDPTRTVTRATPVSLLSARYYSFLLLADISCARTFLSHYIWLMYPGYEYKWLTMS